MTHGHATVQFEGLLDHSFAPARTGGKQASRALVRAVATNRRRTVISRWSGVARRFVAFRAGGTRVLEDSGDQ